MIVTGNARPVRFAIHSDDASDPLIHKLADLVRELSQETLDPFAEHGPMQHILPRFIDPCRNGRLLHF
jgi:hypothetical protein